MDDNKKEGISFVKSYQQMLLPPPVIFIIMYVKNSLGTGMVSSSFETYIRTLQHNYTNFTNNHHFSNSKVNINVTYVIPRVCVEKKHYPGNHILKDKRVYVQLYFVKDSVTN